MKCLVFVRFLPDGAMQPEDFFSQVNAEWSLVEEFEDKRLQGENVQTQKTRKVKSGICIADYDSIEQLSIDLAGMPGTGILNIEIMTVTGEINSFVPSVG